MAPPFRSKVKGQFYQGKWYCDCKPKQRAEYHTVKGDTPNKGKGFYKCKLWNKDGDCKMFLWESDAQAREQAAMRENLRSEPLRPGSKPPARPTEPSVTPTPSYDFRAPSLRAPSHASTVATHLTNINEDETENDFEEAMVKVEPSDFHTATTIGRPELQMATPMTPRTNRAEPMATSGKRKHNEMALEPPPSDGMPRVNLLDSGYHGGESSDRPSKRRAVDYEFLDQISPQSSPTPARYRNAESTVVENTLFKDICDALTPHGVRLNERANHSVQQVCTRYQQKTQGLLNGYVCSYGLQKHVS
jgi:hypothetical protein